VREVVTIWALSQTVRVLPHPYCSFGNYFSISEQLFSDVAPHLSTHDSPSNLAESRYPPLDRPLGSVIAQMAFPLHASEINDKSETGREKTCFSPSRIVTFLPVQFFFVPAGPKCDFFREGCDKKRHKLKKILSCARASHSSQKCDKCDESHFLSPEKVTNVTSLTQEPEEIRVRPTPARPNQSCMFPYG